RLSLDDGAGVAANEGGEVDERPDARSLSRRLDERAGRVHLRPHGAGDEVVAARDRWVDTWEPSLRRLTPVHVHAVDVRRDHELVRTERACEQRARVILVDHGVDALEPCSGAYD